MQHLHGGLSYTAGSEADGTFADELLTAALKSVYRAPASGTRARDMQLRLLRLLRLQLTELKGHLRTEEQLLLPA
jgi:hypothetical protein